MAVARIKMDRRWFLDTAARLDQPDGRLGRELRRAADRPGLEATVTPEELTELEAVAPELDVLVEARMAMKRAEEYEAARLADLRDNHPQRAARR